MNKFKLLSERLRWSIEQKLNADPTVKKITQRAVAQVTEVSPTAVSFWFADTNGMNAEQARKLGSFLGVDPVWLEKGDGEPGAANILSNVNTSKISAVHPDDERLDDVVYVPESKIEFSAGNGRTVTFELIEDQEPATYRLSWFQKYGINPKRVRRFRVAGDSMEPMLFARDTILVNQDETTVMDGKLYAIRYGEELRVKYLSRRLDGTLILRSVNPLYKDEEVSPELANEHITVIGRVRDRSGTGGL